MIIRIYYEDTDAGGVVYHSNYLKFCERARSEVFFDKIDIFDPIKGHFLLTKVNCSFLKSAKLGDILEIKNYLLFLKNASLGIKQNIYKSGELIFSGDFTLAYVKNNKVCIMNNDLKELLKNNITNYYTL